MAIITNPLASFPNVTSYLSYDDVSRLITSVQVINNSTVDLYVQIKTTGPPAKTYDHTWNSGETTSFSTSTAKLYMIYNEIDDVMEFPEGLTIYVRYG